MTEVEEELRALYEAHFAPIHAYFARRVADPADAQELVADVFLVAWRRHAVLPQGSHDRRLWLYGVARRVLADRRKAEHRRRRLADRLRRMRPSGDQDGDDAEPCGGDPRLGAALRSLAPGDREVLTLVAWDELTHAEAATVLGCTTNAFGVRLHRARKRLAAHYAALGDDGRPLPARPAADGRRSSA